MTNTQYKVSVNLDRILEKTGYSQRQLIKDSGISHNFITKLTQHKEVANLDKLVTILNTLNQHGLKIEPDDLITFEPIGKTKIKALANQHKDNDYLFFFQLDYNGQIDKDLIRLKIEQDKTNIKINSFVNSNVPFSADMQTELFKQTFTLGQGVDKMVTVPEKDKKIIAQLLSKMLIAAAIKDKTIKPNKHINTLEFHYLDTFILTFNHVDFKNESIMFTKDINDTIRPAVDNAYNMTYTFKHSGDVGTIHKK